MLKEQLMNIALQAIKRAYEAKERLKRNVANSAIDTYLRSLKDTALFIIEHRLQQWKTDPSSPLSRRKIKKERKSSIKPAKEIGSTKADIILKKISEDKARLVKRNDSLDGKTSLAYLVWALGHAKRASISEGVSVHDVSALLYRACNIELYPINISRVVYGNANLVRQVSQQKRTKTYLLTPEGEAAFKEKFLA